MKKTCYAACLSLFLCFSLWVDNNTAYASDGSDRQTNPFEIIQGDPCAVVAQSVNVITGDFIDMQMDLCIPGAEPLILQRFLNSSSLGDEDPFKACQFNHDISLEKEDHSEFILRDGYGAKIHFDRDYHKKKLKKHEQVDYHIFSEILQKRVTNTGRGEISSRTNLKNLILHKGHKESSFAYH